MDRKRILIAIGFSIFSIFVAWVLWRVFFAPAPAPPDGPGDSIVTPPGAFPGSGEGDPGQIVTPPGTLPPGTTVRPPGTTDQPGTAVEQVSTRVVDSAISAATADAFGTKFYSQQDGRFYRIRNDGTAEALSDEVFFNVSNVTWSPKQNESIIEYPDGSNIYYNFDTKKQVTLPKHWEEFSFSPQADKIAAKSLGFSVENQWLVTANPQGNNITLVEPLGNNADKVIVDWSPNNQVVALSRTGSPLGANRQEVLFIGLHEENFKSTIVEGRGLVTQWSPTGSKLLYSVYNSQNDFKPQLWVVNAQGDSIGSGRKLLQLDTWADKCTFGNDNFAYCGVPTTLPEGSGFQPGLANTIADNLYKVDVSTGLKTQIPIDDGTTINSIFLSDDGKTLFYTDKNKPGIFSVDAQ